MPEYTFIDVPAGATQLTVTTTSAANVDLYLARVAPPAPSSAIPTIAELNIGHFLIGEAIFIGLEDSVRRMRGLMDAARSEGAA